MPCAMRSIDMSSLHASTLPNLHQYGGVGERLKPAVLKTCRKKSD
jgi:hypothetical protein